jgi:hypothetical protein
MLYLCCMPEIASASSLTALTPEVGKKYKVIIDKNNVWASIISDNDRDNSFTYQSTGLWQGASGTNYNFNCEIISE